MFGCHKKCTDSLAAFHPNLKLDRSCHASQPSPQPAAFICEFVYRAFVIKTLLKSQSSVPLELMYQATSSVTDQVYDTDGVCGWGQVYRQTNRLANQVSGAKLTGALLNISHHAKHRSNRRQDCRSCISGQCEKLAVLGLCSKVTCHLVILKFKRPLVLRWAVDR